MSSSNPREEDAAAVSERLDGLREEVLRLEQELGSFGYDPRVGIESRTISELRELMESAGPQRQKVRETLLKLIEVQERLYKELYRLAGSKEQNVDTETPERNLMALKKWLLTGEATPAFGGTTKFKQALNEVARILQTFQKDRAKEILNALRRIYKRDYDRYRVVRCVLEACAKLGGLNREVSDLELLPLESAVRLVDESVEKVGALKLAAHLRAVEAEE
jgi:hypothetical protein